MAEEKKLNKTGPKKKKTAQSTPVETVQKRLIEQKKYLAEKIAAVKKTVAVNKEDAGIPSFSSAIKNGGEKPTQSKPVEKAKAPAKKTEEVKETFQGQPGFSFGAKEKEPAKKTEEVKETFQGPSRFFIGAKEKAPAKKTEEVKETFQGPSRFFSGAKEKEPAKKTKVKKSEPAGQAASKAGATKSFVSEVSSTLKSTKTVFMSGEKKTKELMEKLKAEKSKAFATFKKVSDKFTGIISKPLEFDKLNIKIVGNTMAALKNQINTISTIDAKVTNSMKNVAMLSSKDIGGKSILDNIRTYDANLTRSAKRLVDSLSNRF